MDFCVTSMLSFLDFELSAVILWGAKYALVSEGDHLEKANLKCNKSWWNRDL